MVFNLLQATAEAVSVQVEQKLSLIDMATKG